MRQLTIALVMAVLLTGTAATAVAASSAKVPMRIHVRACASCHGKRGQGGKRGFYPRIGGQHQGYLFRQLKEFREQIRPYPVMRYMVQRLPDKFLKSIAHYFSQKSPPYPPVERNRFSPALIARGRALATHGRWRTGIPACEACHGKDLEGVAPYIPNLLGQPTGYIDAQLGGFASGARGPKGDIMHWVASGLSDRDMRALDAFLSTQRPHGHVRVSLLRRTQGPHKPPVGTRVYNWPHGSLGH